jgi:hypothetical protein
MRRICLRQCGGAVAALAFALSAAPALAGDAGEARTIAARQVLAGAGAKFVENGGQVAGNARFYVQGADKQIVLSPDGVTFVLGATTSNLHPVASAPARVAPARVHVEFVGARPDVALYGEAPTATTYNYFRGDAAQWRAGVRSYARVVYPALWPGIDLVYRGDRDGIKYGFVVHPGADPAQIRLAYAGADAVTVDERGGLAIATSAGGFADQAPVSYQGSGESVRTVRTQFVLAEPGAGRTEVTFALAAFDPTQELVIDPAVNVVVGFLGGGALDELNAIAVDSAGSIYVAGSTLSTAALATAGAVQTVQAGGADAFVAKILKTGAIAYVTYLGGSNDDVANGIAVDATGNAYVTGYTNSANFPHDAQLGDGYFRRTHNTNDGSGTGNGSDVFVTKLDAAGAALLYSGFIGGSSDDVGHAIAIDATGAAYVTGETNAANCTSSDFPVTVGPVLSYTAGGSAFCTDAFVGRIKPDGSGVDYLGFIGGTGGVESGFGIAVNATTGEAYVAGETDSPIGGGFPATAGSFGTTTGGGLAHAFLVKVAANGASFVYAGVLAGNGQDRAFAVAVDAGGNAYLAGDTLSTNLATGGAAQTAAGGNGDPFVAKVNAAGSAVVYATYLGGVLADAAKGIAVDAGGNALVTGFTSAFTSAPTPGLDTTPNGLNDAFLVSLNATGTARNYAGYVGGAQDDMGNAIAVDGIGKRYLAGNSSSTSGFPVTGVPATGTFSQANKGAGDGFVAVIGPWGAPTHFSVVASPGAITAGGSVGLVVTALDAADVVVQDYTGTVHFTSSDGAASLPLDYTFTAGDLGTHSFASGATLRTAGAQVVTATDTVTASLTGVSNVVTVNPGPAAQFVVTAPATATAGVAFSITVTARDAFGNTATGYAGTVHFTGTDPAAVLPADSTLTNGVGTFNATLKTAGTQALTATDTIIPALTGISGPIQVNAAATARFVVVAPATATAGIAFNFSVTAQDAFGNTTPAYAGTVHFTTSDGGASLPADTTLVNGAGTFSATLVTAGTQNITATDTVASGITGTSGNIVVSAGPATRFAAVAPATATAGVAFNYTVTAYDAANNVATGYAGTVHFSATDGAATLPSNAPLTNGVGTFSATLRTPGGQTLTAVDTVNASLVAISGTITVSAGAAVSFTVSAPAAAVAGTAFNFTVTALDAFSNVATGYAGTAHFTATDAQAVLPGNSTLVNGVGTFSATLKTAGTHTLTATDTVTASLKGTSGTIVVTAGAPATITATGGTPQSAIVLAPFATPLQATVRDAANNPVQGVSVTFTAPGSGASATPAGATAITDVNGVATSPAYTANAIVGAYTVSAAAAGIATPANFALTNNPWTVFSGTTATGTGIATATLSGGGPTCTLTTAAFVGLPAAAPPSVSFPDGLFDFTATGCAGSVTVSIVFPTAFTSSTAYWKYGPVPPGPLPKPSQWYTLGGAQSLTLSGHTATFTIADGGLGDDDLAVNGTIVDQGGPGNLQVNITPVPALGLPGIAILGALLLLLGFEGRRRRITR